MLAAEIPDVENGGVAADGKSVTWKLRTGVQWHDGQPFTADDVVFNWEYASDPATAATTIGSYQDVEVEKIDSFTARVRFAKPTPFWAGRANGLIIPKHLFEPYKGANSREAGKPEAGGDRPLSVRRLRARRFGQRRAQSRLSCVQPAVFPGG